MKSWFVVLLMLSSGFFTMQMNGCPPQDNDGDSYTTADDCNDNDTTVHPGADEVVDDGIDQDCDGVDATRNELLLDEGIVLPVFDMTQTVTTTSGDTLYASILFVLFTEGTTSETMTTAITSVNGQQTGTLDELGLWISIPAAATYNDLMTTVQVLEAQTGVDEVGVEGTLVAHDIPLDVDSLPVDQAWSFNAIQLRQGYDYLSQAVDAGLVIHTYLPQVAVIDNGFDVTHPDLEDRIALTLNGKPVMNFADATGTDITPDEHWCSASHGTSVAGVVAARNNVTDDDAQAPYGVNGVTIYSQVFPLAVGAHDQAGAISTPAITAAIYYAMSAGVDMINLSVGGKRSDEETHEFVSLKHAIQRATLADVVVVASAGNDDVNAHDYYPVSFPDVIGVGATQQDESVNARWIYGYYSPSTSCTPAGNYGSNYGDAIDITAPGVDIWSLDVAFNEGDPLWKNSMGTSLSAPFVSGLVALAMQVNQFDVLTPTTAQQLLQDTADWVSTDTGYWPRINVLRMLQAVIEGQDQNAIDNDTDTYTESAGDCDDTNPMVYPGAAETCGDGVDQDCSGVDLSCDDVDDDIDTYTENEGDCDDTDPDVYPQAAEVCEDGIDQDCDGVDPNCEQAVTWNKTFGGDNEDYVHSVQQTSDGGYIMAGYTGSYNSGGADFWLIKTDNQGVQEWSRTYGGSKNDVANSVKQTSDGGYIVAGSTYSYGSGSSDAWLVKTDVQGTQEWSRTYGKSNWDYAQSVQQTTDGGYIVAGHIDTSYGGGLLIKTNNQGQQEWSWTYGEGSWDAFQSVQQTNDGGYIMAGYIRLSSYDFWLVKTDVQGTQEWAKTFGGSDSDYAYSVQQTNDGGYILAGYGYTGSNDRDALVIKTDDQGMQEWSRTFGGDSDDWFYAVQQTRDYGYILTGFTYPEGSSDFWLIKLDSAGFEKWNQTFGGNNGDVAKSVQQTTDGGYIMAGYAYSDAGSTDAWVIKTDQYGNAPATPQ